MYSPDNSPCTASITLDGALWDKENTTSAAPLTFVKVAPLPDDLIENYTITGIISRDMPVRQERTHVPDPEIHHDLPTDFTWKVGRCIAVGRCGLAFEIEPVGLPSNAPNAKLPPLIAKIGRQHYSKWLLRECWFYEEMQSLQGTIIPWCYGLYHARIPVTPGRPFLPWIEGWRRSFYRSSSVDIETLVRVYEQLDGKDDNDENDLKVEKDTLQDMGGFREQYADLVKQFEDEDQSGQRTTVVTILVLERLGEAYLPLGGVRNWPMDKPIPEDMTKEVYCAYDKIHELGITHMDIKRLNILKAPEREIVDEGTGPDRDPNVRTCKCRIIDFELSKKGNYTTQLLNYSNRQFIDRMIDNLPTGSSIGQNY